LIQINQFVFVWFFFIDITVEIVKILIDNEELRLKVRHQQEDLEMEQKEAEERMEEKVEFETALLQQRIKHLVRDLEDEKQRNQMEKNALEEDRRDLESRLDMLRTEFDRLDEYWQVLLENNFYARIDRDLNRLQYFSPS
jgi:biopolymer transport protein ExbB/TolQ